MLTTLSQHIDFLIFVAFLLINLAVGLLYSRSVKDLKDYAVGGRNFSNAALVATIVATAASGSSMFLILENTYSKGLYYLIGRLGLPTGLLLTGLLATRMAEFLNNVSVAEAMGDMYGKTVRVITAICGILARTGLVAVQFKAMAKILAMLLGLESTLATVVAASIVIAYSSLGGVKAITFTDMLQFFTFGTILPILALTVWNKVGDPAQVSAVLAHNSMFSFKEVIGTHSRFMSTLGLFLFFAIPGINPSNFQRIAMAKDHQQVKQVFTYSAGILLLIFLVTAWISILLLAENATLSAKQVVPYLVQHHTYPGLRGLLGIGVLALAMSTADSCLNTCSVLFTHDLVKPLAGTNYNSVRTARLFSLCLGLLALLMAFYSQDLLKLVLLSGSLYKPIYTVPFLMAVLGFRSTKRVVLLGMGAGFTTVVAWSLCYGNAGSVVPGMLANLIVLFGSHYLLGEPGGWQEVDPKSPLGLRRLARQRARQLRQEAWEDFHLVPYLKANLPEQTYFYFFLGLYVIATTYVSFYTIDQACVASYGALYGGSFYLTLIGATLLCLLPTWPRTLNDQRFMAFFWPACIGVLLFVVGPLLAIMGHFHSLQTTLMLVHLLIALLLLRWPVVVVLAVAGPMLAVFLFKYSTDLPLLPNDFAGIQLSFMHMLLFLSVFLIVFFKSKQAFRELEKENIRLRLARTLTQEELEEAFHHRELVSKEAITHTVNALNTIQRLKEQLEESLPSPTTHRSAVTLRRFVQAVNDKFQALTNYFHQTLHQVKSYIRLQEENMTVITLVRQVFDLLEQTDPSLVARVYTRRLATQTEFQGDVNKIKQLMVRAVQYARKQCQGGEPILWGISDTLLGYPVVSTQGHIREVQALCLTITTRAMLPETRRLYMGNIDKEPTRLPRSEAELSIIQNQRIVDAHYGASELIEHEEGIETQVYVIPVNVREVRPKTMDLAPVPDFMREEEEVYPEEEALLHTIKHRTEIPPVMVKEALETIKKYYTGLRTRSGQPFYLHAVAVARILLEHTQDEVTIVASLLQDTVANTPLSLAQIELNFNTEIKDIVEGATQLDNNLIAYKRMALSGQEALAQLLETYDRRVLYIKLADSLHKMRHLKSHASLTKRRHIAEESHQFFMPIARQLGLGEVVAELDELTFDVLITQR